MMRAIIDFIIGWLFCSFFVFSRIATVFIGILCGVSFVTWEPPEIPSPDDALYILRVIIAVSVFVGFFFADSTDDL
ncbi:hypothetical protein [Escherichia coli]|uniref:hypothetical protein n=1 Tax=Escherichia coli TaxID=562 RepID=UPI0012FF7F8A|nr:hypothetical protein [Escherichia coli]HAL6015731.1 hypothetical protein [Escherichia coli]